MKVAVAIAGTKIIEVGEPDKANGQSTEDFLQCVKESVQEDPMVLLDDIELAVVVLEIK